MTKRPDLPYLRRKQGRRRVHWYFERAGERTPLPDPSSPDFLAAYERARRGTPATAPSARRTFAALVTEYRRSDRFARLAPRTRADYEKVLTWVNDKIGHLPVEGLKTPHVYRAQAENAATVRFANYIVQVLRLLCGHAIRLGWIERNPAEGVEMLKPSTPPRQPWPAEAIAAYRAAADGKALLIFELLHGTGQRIGDVLRMRWDDLEDGGVWVRQGKTGARLWVPLTPALTAALADTPRRGLTIVTAHHGRPLSYRMAHQAVMAVRRQIGAEAHDLHALRYSAASELAAAGCTDEQIQAITGHTTTAMVRRYAGAARQRTRAKEAQTRRGDRTAPERER